MKKIGCEINFNYIFMMFYCENYNDGSYGNDDVRYFNCVFFFN